ncbi:hypothetical protein OE88DRAFT_1735157 [Heliocybe sulcata]|uniref:Uncharacterized protein n=1 Tax=Heliocybe sulcata TaxID=5364 RepID=A0A5C3N0F7_9AGAM|nr:hypothetical protein OE88DRAFT_1735157 [Heliocybe sulcata]
MADLTLLSTSSPLDPSLTAYVSSNASRSTTSLLSRISSANHDLPKSPSTPNLPRMNARPNAMPVLTESPPSSPARRGRDPTTSSQFLSPPRNTFKAPQRHRRQRSSSAPPPLQLPPAAPYSAAPSSAYSQASPRVASPRQPATAPLPRKSNSLPLPAPKPSYLGVNPRTGILLPPPPPLFRPTPFWRHQSRASSPTSQHHLVRRSTFLAAGMELEKPYSDLSALGVEMRVGKAGVLVMLPT